MSTQVVTLVKSGQIKQIAVSDDTAQSLAFQALQKLKRIRELLIGRN